MILVLYSPIMYLCRCGKRNDNISNNSSTRPPANAAGVELMGRSYKLWTAADEEKLVVLIDEGLPRKQIAADLGRTLSALQHHCETKGLVVRKVTAKDPTNKKRPMIVIKCANTYCGKKKSFKRAYFNREKKRGQEHFFCSVSCARSSAEKSKVKRKVNVGYLPGAVAAELKFYANQRYG